MKWFVSVLTIIQLWSLPVMAETYTWTDKNGTVNFSDDYSSVPKQYRKKARRLGDMDASPTSADTGKSSASATASPVATGTNPVDGLYGGKKAGVWQQEFKVREAEYKQLENRLTQLESLIKNPVGISQERMWKLPQEFRETQKQYNEALRAYNDLNDAANKAQLPAEFRK